MSGLGEPTPMRPAPGAQNAKVDNAKGLATAHQLEERVDELAAGHPRASFGFRSMLVELLARLGDQIALMEQAEKGLQSVELVPGLSPGQVERRASLSADLAADGLSATAARAEAQALLASAEPCI